MVRFLRARDREGGGGAERGSRGGRAQPPRRGRRAASGPWQPMGACGGWGRRFPSALARGGGGAMSVAFVPERLRGKAEVNQETLQRVSAGAMGRGGGGTGPPGSAEAEPALPASARGGGSRRARGGR